MTLEYEIKHKDGRAYCATQAAAVALLNALPDDQLPATVLQWGHGAIVAERAAPEPLEVRHYELVVHRGARAGLRKTYGYSQRAAARRFADKLDREYGAICASVRPVFTDSGAQHGYDFASVALDRMGLKQL